MQRRRQGRSNASDEAIFRVIGARICVIACGALPAVGLFRRLIVVGIVDGRMLRRKRSGIARESAERRPNKF